VLFEIGMGVTLLIGAALARMRWLRLHAWCQSVIIVLNLVVIVSFFSRSCESEDTAQNWNGLLRTGDRAWGARKRHGSRRIVHPALCRHECFATQIPSVRIQTMDAQSARALVARAPVGTCNICPLECPGLVSEMNRRLSLQV
jgi:hypothetical protein